MDLNKIINKAKISPFQLKLLNAGLNRMIPFNRPHKFKILSISDNEINTYLPYKKRNLNHLNGLHAGALVTLSEFTTGVYLLSKVTPDRYRIILKHLSIAYHYQGKSDAFATFSATEDWLKTHVIQPLDHDGMAEVTCQVKVIDNNQNHLATSEVTWQLKDWEQVKTSKN